MWSVRGLFLFLSPSLPLSLSLCTWGVGVCGAIQGRREAWSGTGGNAAGLTRVLCASDSCTMGDIWRSRSVVGMVGGLVPVNE